jgi:hypothetical protein
MMERFRAKKLLHPRFCAAVQAMQQHSHFFYLGAALWEGSGIYSIAAGIALCASLAYYAE